MTRPDKRKAMCDALLAEIGGFFTKVPEGVTVALFAVISKEDRARLREMMQRIWRGDVRMRRRSRFREHRMAHERRDVLQKRALAVASHKPNVPIDLSGRSADHFPAILIRYANSMLEKARLGSDWPMISPDKWPAAFEKAPFKAEVREAILKNDAAHRPGLT
ncbi:MAG: hypothetical protein EP318_04050 [Rhodobacteraceae bacterium]|nr:MAG: hypothetical protein EP318_04050 [Paracoccaceae bacterium]